MLTEKLKILSEQAAPSPDERKQLIASALARCCELESQLGIVHAFTPPIPPMVSKRLAQLEALAAGKAPFKAVDVAHAAKPAITRPKSEVGGVKLSRVSAPESGLRIVGIAEFYKMDAATRAQFCRDGGHLSRADFDKMSLRSRSEFCIGGGRLIDDAPSGPIATSTASRNFSNH